MTELVVVEIAGQRAGVPVARVRNAVGPQPVQRVPRAHPTIAGVLNLRGRVATAIDVRRCLGIAGEQDEEMRPALVVEVEGAGLYALLVDRIDEIRDLDGRVSNPADIKRLLPGWERYVRVVHDTPQGIVVELDVEQLVEPALSSSRAA